MACAQTKDVAGPAADAARPAPRQTYANAPKPTVTSPRLYVFDCGTLVQTNIQWAGFEWSEVANPHLSVSCYLVAHPKGLLLFDAGVDDRQVGIPLYAASGGGIKSKTLLSQLAEINVRPDMVDYVAVSHGHFDHTGNVGEFSASTWLTNAAERAAMYGQPPPSNYRPALYASLQANPTTVITGDHDVFGDGSVVLLQTPGHSPGHMSLYVRLRNTGGVILTGDLFHYPEQRTSGRMPPSEQAAGVTATSRVRVEAFARTRGAQIWIGHDMNQFRLLRRAPAWYE
jgi:glyoxylase-like metal-dependent hydrolase (beta-lactamase superfamily II)